MYLTLSAAAASDAGVRPARASPANARAAMMKTVVTKTKRIGLIYCSLVIRKKFVGEINIYDDDRTGRVVTHAVTLSKASIKCIADYCGHLARRLSSCIAMQDQNTQT